MDKTTKEWMTLRMKKSELELNTYNHSKFVSLWQVSPERAREYAEHCQQYWEEYVKSNNPVGEKIIAESKEQVEVPEVVNPIVTPVLTEEGMKQMMVDKLKASGMKLASTKRNMATLEKHVAKII